MFMFRFVFKNIFN